MVKRIFYKIEAGYEAEKEDYLYFAEQYDSFFWMDDHGYLASSDYFKDTRPEIILGIGSFADLKNESLTDFQVFSDTFQKDWILGYLSYELKNEFEKLNSPGPDPIGFNTIDFFCPRYLFLKKDGFWSFGFFPEIEAENFSPPEFIATLKKVSKPVQTTHQKIDLKPDVDKMEYLSICRQVLDHIHRGDIYEMNLCMHFIADQVKIDPILTYLKLSEISATPFAGMLKRNERYLLCASPERYLAGDAAKVISQPIKGTIARNANPIKDFGNAEYLRNDPKERAENIMIVDLVRNDLSKFAQRSSVKVEELCSVRPFPKVWQMTSTISCIPEKNKHIADMISSSFPMGSMTGAPKVRAMQLIDQYEKTSRGLYSGSMGFLGPDGVFDLNVVIRSIVYNRTSGKLAFSAGSAITSLSDPEKEYAECILKAASMAQSLGMNIYEL